MRLMGLTRQKVLTLLSQLMNMEQKKYIFETRMEVRDYECDIQGIVNNANYLHYTEHTRHRFLRSLGVSFADLHEKGVDAVVARMQLTYKVPLTCDDEIISRCLLYTSDAADD